MRKFPEIAVPHVVRRAVGTRVLTTEFVTGIKISDVDELRAAGFDTDALGATFIRAVDQAGPDRRLLPRRPASRATSWRTPTKRPRVPRPRARRSARRGPARRPPRACIYAVKRGRHPGHRRRPASRSATPTPDVRRGRSSGPTSIASPGSTSSTARRDSSAARSTAFMGAVFDNGLRLDSSLTLAIKADIQAEERRRVLSPGVDIARRRSRRPARRAIGAHAGAVEKVTSSPALRVGSEFVRRGCRRSSPPP